MPADHESRRRGGTPSEWIDDLTRTLISSSGSGRPILVELAYMLLVLLSFPLPSAHCPLITAHARDSTVQFLALCPSPGQYRLLLHKFALAPLNVPPFS